MQWSLLLWLAVTKTTTTGLAFELFLYIPKLSFLKLCVMRRAFPVGSRVTTYFKVTGMLEGAK